MRNKEIDVAVVGGGPAGLASATYAARGGLTVKVFEKKREIGLPVRCGEFLPTVREMRNLLPKADGIPELFTVPDSAVANKCRVIRVYSPKGKSWEFDFDANVLHRHAFERFLAEEATDSGVELTLGTRAKIFLENGRKYVGKSREEAVKARIVVAADGFPSETCRDAKLPVESYVSPYSVATVIQHQMCEVNVEEDVTEMYFDPRYAPGGFVYVIPKGHRVANVGLGVRTPYMHARQQVRGLLETFVTKHRVARERLSMGKCIATVADVLPIDGPISRTVNDSVMAVGDAAGMVIPTTGGGIPTALVAGKLAGEVAVGNLSEGVPLSAYDVAWRRQIGEALSNATRVKRVADMFVSSGFFVHGVFSVLGVRGIRDVISCRVPWGMSPVLALLQMDHGRRR